MKIASVLDGMYAKNKMEAMSMYDVGENSHLTTKFEFLKNYKECKGVIAREIDRSAKKVVTLKMELIMFQKYLQHSTTELNSFQGYILCDFLKMLGKTTLVKTSDEAMHIYFAFVMYCSAYIQELDLDQVFCVSHKFYVVLFDLLMAMNVDDDLTLFAECLDEITNYFIIAPTSTRKFILNHTFEEEDDACVTKLKNVYDKHHQSLTWESVAFRMSNFLYCIGYNYINTTEYPIAFSHEFITLVTLLVRNGGEDYFNLNMFTLFAALEFYREPECHSHLNLDFINYCVFTAMAQEPHAVCKSTMLHSITCVLDQMMIKGFVMPRQNFVEIFYVLNTIYTTASHSLIVEEQILKFIFAIYKFHNYDLKETGCMTFLENIVCDDDVEALLYLQVLFTILKQTAVPSAVLFENMCVNYTSFTRNKTLQRLYAAVMCKMMEYDDDDKSYRSILVEYPECLELQCMAYVKYILVHTSLFDKCKLYITEHAHQWTRDELREIEHLI